MVNGWRKIVGGARRPISVPGILLAALLLALTFMVMTYTANFLDSDPDAVYIEDLSAEIDPKEAILEQCASSVVKVEGIDSGDESVMINGERFQRWKVSPRSGHVDRVLLSIKTGAVVCG